MRVEATISVHDDVTLIADDVQPAGFEGLVMQGPRFPRAMFVRGRYIGQAIGIQRQDVERVWADEGPVPVHTMVMGTTIDCILEF